MFTPSPLPSLLISIQPLLPVPKPNTTLKINRFANPHFTRQSQFNILAGTHLKSTVNPPSATRSSHRHICSRLPAQPFQIPPVSVASLHLIILGLPHRPAQSHRSFAGMSLSVPRSLPSRHYSSVTRNQLTGLLQQEACPDFPRNLTCHGSFSPLSLLRLLQGCFSCVGATPGCMLPEMSILSIPPR